MPYSMLGLAAVRSSSKPAWSEPQPSPAPASEGLRAAPGAGSVSIGVPHAPALPADLRERRPG